MRAKAAGRTDAADSVRQPVLLCWGRDDKVAAVEGALFS
jgi:hypothetical protein